MDLDLDSLKKRALSVMDTEKKSASEAVASVLSGSAASPEHVHRLCAKVNRAALQREKQSHTQSSRWQVRFETAKPEEVMERLGRPKHSSAKPNPLASRPEGQRVADGLEYLMHKLSHVPQERRDAYASQREKISRQHDYAGAKTDAETALQIQRDVRRRSVATLYGAEMELRTKRSSVVSAVEESHKRFGFSYGELLHSVRQVVDVDSREELSREFDQVCDDLIKRSGFSLAACSGNERDELGKLRKEVNEAATKLWQVREKVASAKVNPNSPLSAAAREWEEAVTRYYACSDVASKVSEDLREMEATLRNV